MSTGHVLHPEYHVALAAAWSVAAAAFARYQAALARLDGMAGDTLLHHALRQADADEAGPAAVAAAAELLDALHTVEAIARSTCRPAGWHPEVVHGAAASLLRS